MRALIFAVVAIFAFGCQSFTKSGNSALEGGEIHTLRQVDSQIAAGIASGKAQQMAASLATVDSWTVRPEDEEKCRQAKLRMACQLRKQVKLEVNAIQSRSLAAPTSMEGATLHAAAGQTLSLYPMSEDQAVLDEARSLSASQGEIANRLDSLRRQRYNRWAAQQIEAAIKGYHANSSYFNPKKENQRLIHSLVQTLGLIDPALIEPAVLELYNYAIETTKGSISEADKINLAKALCDPSLHRKTLGDF